MPSEPNLREQICRYGRILYERGHNAPGDGNLSARISERYLLCTPTGVHKGEIKPRDVVKVRIRDGHAVDPAQHASAEVRMHLALYRHRPELGAIVHAHSPYTVALSVAGIDLTQPVVPEAILALGSVPTVPYASPTTEDVPEAVIRHVGKSQAFVLERHGPVALGATLAEAFSRIEVIEHTARITAVAMSVGSVTPIDDAEAERLRRMAGLG
ncbi:MAG: class II aldolase/adducin family protein [Myxococcota bacterium]